MDFSMFISRNLRNGSVSCFINLSELFCPRLSENSVTTKECFSVEINLVWSRNKMLKDNGIQRLTIFFKDFQ